MEDKDRFVDELLDSTLAHYRDAEPRAGLEGRILEHVRAAGHPSNSSKARKLRLAAAATAAVAVLVAAIYMARRPQNSAVRTPQASDTVSVPAPAPRETLKANSEPTPAAGPATKVAEPKRTAHRESKPTRRVQAHRWPSQFPTPAPLTPEQRALVQYVRETPPQVLATPILKAEFTVPHVEIKPLEIPPLEIKPLTLDRAGKKIN